MKGLSKIDLRKSRIENLKELNTREFLCLHSIKSTHMVDLKISLYVSVNIKTIPVNFAFLILRILELFAREAYKLRKK